MCSPCVQACDLSESCRHGVVGWEGCPQSLRAPSPVSPNPDHSLHRLLANGAELAEVPSINGAEYKQNKAFISQAVVSLLIYFTVHRLYVCARVFSAGVICSSE